MQATQKAAAESTSGTKRAMGHEIVPQWLAEQVSFWSGWVLVAALAIGVIATGASVISANIKEGYWEDARIGAASQVAELTTKGDDARAELAKSNEKIAGLTVQAEQLRKDTAEAQATAAQATLALAQFKAPRQLSDPQLAAITATVGPFSGVHFDMSLVSNTPEAAALIAPIASAVQAAG